MSIYEVHKITLQETKANVRRFNNFSMYLAEKKTQPCI